MTVLLAAALTVAAFFVGRGYQWFKDVRRLMRYGRR
jgi:hypothetical protein